MSEQIIVDSCCDLTDAIKQQLNLRTVPLNLNLGDDHYVDDESLDIPAFLAAMQQCTGKVGSSAPSPTLYQQEYEAAAGKQSYVVTLSSRLSSSYDSAVLGAQMLEEHADRVHVFDSKSAAAGELLVAYQIHDLVKAGHGPQEVIAKVEQFIHEMKTYFVLDSIDNLLKNGRLSKLKGALINILNIKPLLGSDGDGNIISYANCRGQSNIVKKMVATITDSGKATDGLRAVIAHCHNEGLAQRLKDEILAQFNFKEIVIVPTRGVSSLYANEKGVILAY